MSERVTGGSEVIEWANVLADLIEDYRDRYVREQGQRLPRAVDTIVRMLREGDVKSARKTFRWESDKIVQFPELYEFLSAELAKGGEYLTAVFYREDGLRLGDMQVRNRPKFIKKELQGSIPRGATSAELMGEEGETIMRLIYGMRAEVEAAFAADGRASPIQDEGYYEGIPGVNFIVEEFGHDGFEIDVPVPYDFGDNVCVEEVPAPTKLIPRQKELQNCGYRRAAVLASDGDGREDDYIYFMRCIQEAQHLNEKVIVLGLGDYFELFVQSDRDGFCLPSTYND